jgi:hypothetical protein
LTNSVIVDNTAINMMAALIQLVKNKKKLLIINNNIASDNQVFQKL